MKRMHSVLLVLSGTFVGFLCGAMVTTAYSDQMKYNYDQVVGQAGETVITRGELAEYLLTMDATRTAKGNPPTLGFEKLTGEFLDQALVKEAARKANVTITAEEIDARINEAYEFAESAMAKTRFESVPRPVLEEAFRPMLLVEKMLHLTVTEAEAREYYFKNPSVFTRPPMAKLICIQTTNKTNANTALKRLRAGEDPRKLSEMYSTDENLKKKRGETGWLVRSRMGPDIGDAIFDANDYKGLKRGECTDVIPVLMPDAKNPESMPPKDNYFIFYVEEIDMPYSPKFEEIKNAAIYFCRANKYNQLAPEWFSQQAKTTVWKQITDFRNPEAPLETMPINSEKYLKPEMR